MSTATNPPRILTPPDPLREAEELVKTWLDGNYEEPLESRMPDILRAILHTRSSIPLVDVMSMLPQLTNIFEGRHSIPLLHWPWLDPTSIDLLCHSNIYSALADALHRTSGCTIYAYGNGLRLHGYSGSKQLYYVAKNEEFLEEAPEHGSSFEKYYHIPGHGEGVTLNSAPHPPRSSDGNAFWHVRPEVAILVALTKSREQLHSLVISVLISMTFVQAVGLSQGVSVSKCDDVVRNMCTTSSTDQIGGQIAVLAAVYSRLTSPLEHSITMRPEPQRYVTVPFHKLSVESGVAPVNTVALSNNMYWLEKIGESTFMKSRTERRVVFTDDSDDALFVRELLRPVQWFGTAFAVIALSIVSVVFQTEVGWAERLEKFLNLLFTATVATLIGLAGEHPEKNVLMNVLRGRRRIVDADAAGKAVFVAVLDKLQNVENPGRFVAPQQATWVSDSNHGTTLLGRPVRLDELRDTTVSVSSSYELCVKSKHSFRNLLLSTKGIAQVAGQAAATTGRLIALTAEVRVS